MPEIPEAVSDSPVAYAQPSYGSCVDACSALSAAIDAVETAIDDRETRRDELQNIADTAEGLEFPGMFG